MKDDEKFAVVTTVTQHRMRYVISESELQSLNTEDPVDLIIWADDSVVCEEIEDFSQEYLGEVIIDTVVEDLDQVLARFDIENEYLASWTKEQKINFLSRRLMSSKDKGNV